MRTVVLIILCALIQSGCTTVPEQIQGEYAGLTPARADTAQIGNAVRWGGVILKTSHSQAKTCFEILSRNLDKYLRPKLEDNTAGRFMACADGFYDPMVFTRGREVTMTGTLKDISYQQLEDFNYRYPVLEVNDLVLWQKRQKVLVYNHYGAPYGYGYWGRPYWGYYGWYGHPYGSHRAYVREMTLLPDAAEVEAQPSPLRPLEQPK